MTQQSADKLRERIKTIATFVALGGALVAGTVIKGETVKFLRTALHVSEPTPPTAGHQMHNFSIKPQPK